VTVGEARAPGGTPLAAGAMLGILVIAFNLRIGVVSVGPVLEQIRADTGMSSAVAGVMTTIPFVCMGGFSIAGGPVMRRLGTQRTVTIAMLLTVAGTLLRAATATPILLLVTTIPIGVGLALANSAIPTVVKDRFPDRAGAVTGAYVAALGVGSASVTAGIVPLSERVGGWQGGFALSAVPAVIAIAVWQATRAGRDVSHAAGDVSNAGARPMRTAVMLGLVFAFQSICYSAMVSWGPAVFTDAGWSESRAALVTAVFPLVTIPAALFIPALSDGGDRRPWMLACAALQSIAMVAIAIAPNSVPWLLITLFAFGNGGCFALALTLPLDFAGDPSEAAWLMSWVLCIGFLISALSPVFVGALRALTGGLSLPIALVGTVGSLGGVLAMRLRTP
jgi:CP family cyanate transporter-like MFS transporter